MSGCTPAPSAAQQSAQLEAAHQFLIEEFTLLSVGTLFVTLRTISRLLSVGIKKFQLDDYLMLFALVLYGLESGAAYMVVFWYHGAANSGLTECDRMHLQSEPLSDLYLDHVNGSKVQVVGWNVYSLLLWTLKMCMCIFYARLTLGLGDAMKMRIRIGYVLIVVTYIATMLAINLACHPFNQNWQIYPDPGNTCQPAISRVNCLVVVILNVLTDLYLMSIPLPLLWKAQLPMKRKVLLLAMFSGGFFVIACAILRCALILIDPITGAQQAGSWAVRETFVAVIIGNLPMVYKLFRLAMTNGTERIKDRTQRSRTGRVELTGQDGTEKSQGGAYFGGSRISNKKNRFLHPLSTRDETMSESMEELQMETIKEHGSVVTTEVIMQEQKRAHTPSGLGSGKYMARDENYIYAGPEHKQAKFTTTTVHEDEISSSSSSGYRSPR